jgi:hypothetical protein
VRLGVEVDLAVEPRLQRFLAANPVGEHGVELALEHEA